jgi:hypothetical protein
MKKSVPCLLLAGLVFAQGCCSIFTPGPQQVSVDSEPQGADVRIGSFTGKTPYKADLPKGRDYVVEVSYGQQRQTTLLNKNIEPLYWVNILFWPGLIVDLATGKMYVYEPAEYTFTFEQ